MATSARRLADWHYRYALQRPTGGRLAGSKPGE